MGRVLIVDDNGDVRKSLDLMMPTLDGLSFLEMLRKNPAWAQIRVVVYTGYDQGVDTNRLRELGVGEIMLKGAIDVTRLINLINC